MRVLDREKRSAVMGNHEVRDSLQHGTKDPVFDSCHKGLNG